MENEEMIAIKEEALLKIYDREEDLNAIKKEIEDKLSTIKKDSEDKIGRIENELLHVEENIAALESKRGQMAKPIPKRLMFTYNRIRKGLGNVAIVNVKRRACGGCFQQLTPQTVQELIKGDHIITCPSCGRILSWNEDLSPAE
jgi:predicted  nucleic acid-binding Zn-ribbon protein